jgi:hypothetical protein
LGPLLGFLLARLMTNGSAFGVVFDVDADVDGFTEGIDVPDKLVHSSRWVPSNFNNGADADDKILHLALQKLLDFCAAKVHCAVTRRDNNIEAIISVFLRLKRTIINKCKCLSSISCPARETRKQWM